MISAGGSATWTGLFLLVCAGIFLIPVFRLPRQVSFTLSVSWLAACLGSFLAFRMSWGPAISAIGPTDLYDPLRYWSLVEAGVDWRDPSVGLTYPGVVAYIATARELFNGYLGVLFFNGLASLTAISLLAKAALHSRYLNANQTVVLCALLIIPDFVWFMTLSGRESIATSLAMMVFASIMLARHSVKAVSLAWMMCAVTTMAGLALIRPPVGIIASAACVGLIAWSVYMGRAAAPIGVAAGAALLAFSVLVLLLPALNVNSGTGLADPSQIGKPAPTTTSASSLVGEDDRLREEPNALPSDDEASRSLTSSLPQSNHLEVLLSAPIRWLIGVVGPLGPRHLELVGDPSSYETWQAIAAIATSLILLAIFPAAIFATFHRPNRQDLWATIICWTFVVGVAAGTPFVSERYRLVSLPWLLLLATKGGPAVISRRFVYFLIPLGGLLVALMGFWVWSVNGIPR